MNKTTKLMTVITCAATLSTPAFAGSITIDFNVDSGQNVDIFGNSQGTNLFFTGTDGFEVIFTDDNSFGSFGGNADGVHISNINYGNDKVGDPNDYVLGAYNAFFGGNNYHSSGIVARFNQGATLVSFDDTDDDGTLKRLFAYDENGVLIGQSGWASQVPVVVDTSLTGGALIYSVEFDTYAGTAGGSFDGTYFTIDNFHVEGVSPDNQVDIGFPGVPAPGALALLGFGLLGLGTSRRFS